MSASLANDWLARISAQRASELTNADPPTAASAGSLAPTAYNATALNQAVTDTQADFAQRTGVAYDGTQAAHVNAGIRGVTYFLMIEREIPGTKSLEAAEKLWVKACARVTPLLPGTSSQLTPSTDCGTPDFDRQRFGDITLQAPGTNASGNNLEPGLFA